jgi:Sigma-54 interaction domain
MSKLEPAVNRPRVGLQDAEAALLKRVPAHNLLLIGPSSATRAVIDDLMSSLVAPVVCWDGGTADLPSDSIGSLIIHGVASLTPANQHRLLEWLKSQSPRRSVIATSIEPFYPDVETGLFSDSLYYRLNTVTVQLDRQPDSNAPHIAFPST